MSTPIMSTPILKLTASDLAALLCARICHDLVSPIGALGAALEVFDDDDNLDMRDDALDLIRMSARQASAKLQFLRLAFGAGGSAPGIIATQELKTLSVGVYGEGKACLEWQFGADSLEKGAARVLLNLVMLALQSIPRGGTMVVKTNETDAGTQMSFVCTGMKARLDAKAVQCLHGKAPEGGFDGRTIQPFYTGMIIREQKGRIETDIVDETVTFEVFLPRVEAA